MTLELTVRNKKYTVTVDSRGTFYTNLDLDNGHRQLTADTLKGLEQKLTAATRVQSSKVAIKFKRLGRKPAHSYSQRGYSYRPDSEGPWEVIVVTVRGINEHTGHLMVTWPDGKKSDDEEIGRYNRDKNIYFPMEMDEKEILHHRHQIDESEAWLKKHSTNVVDLAKKAVAEALGETSGNEDE